MNNLQLFLICFSGVLAIISLAAVCNGILTSKKSLSYWVATLNIKLSNIIWFSK
jgi:hypothetical protein